ncbi:MAG TPA: ABC transporter ATP-binding protein [Bordetella sp.]|nr:ABC transporter ATP-binding protein [Bordetella sp.]
MLRLEGVQSGYGASQVLFGVDLAIGAGDVVTLLGRNGMGKTTLLRTLYNQLPLKAGRIHFDGHDISGWATDRIARAGIAIVPEGRLCFPNLTVREHLTAFATARGRVNIPCADASARASDQAPRGDTSPRTSDGAPSSDASPWTPERVCELFPRLAERASHMGNQLSGGEQQMLAIGRALVTNPRLLILDEATEGLAPKVREEIWACLARLRAAGQTILVIDKYVERLLALADRHMILERGRVVWTGDSRQLDADRGLWTRYLGI